MLGLLRLRVALVTLMMGVVALAAGDIFDRRAWWLLVPPAMVGLTAALTCVRRWPIRLAWALGTAAAATTIGRPRLRRHGIRPRRRVRSRHPTVALDRLAES